MQRFAKARDGPGDPPSAQNARSSIPNRQTIAANAKVSTKSRQSHPVHAPSGTPSRALGNLQNTSAPIQHAPHQRVSGQTPKRDLYDTDAESIDTTVNQEGNNQQGHQQLYSLPDHIVDLGSESESGEDSEVEEGGDGEEAVDVKEEYADYVLTQEEVDYLKQEGLGNLSRPKAIAFLLQTRSQGFRAVEGDSYPTTTEGDPSEWLAQEPPHAEHYDDDGQVSPSPQRHPINGRRIVTPRSTHRGPIQPAFDRTMDRPHAMFNQSAAIRNQQRANNSHGQQSGHQSHAALLGSTQPPSYSQASRDVFPPEAPHPQSRPELQMPFQQPQQSITRHAPGPSQVTLQPPRPVKGQVPTKRTWEAPSEECLTVIQPPVDQPQVEEEQAHPDGDYDLKTLHAMKYDKLKDESFDIDPRAPYQPLSEESLQKPLLDRLEHVQKNLEPIKQSEFFKSLPTTEWEDAGDWFLDRFSSIITRTKEARQKKRKLAKGFEDEIEKRHKHVDKKQHQVEDAMNKMKAQGEGLVPRSSKKSKSPMQKKR